MGRLQPYVSWQHSTGSQLETQLCLDQDPGLMAQEGQLGDLAKHLPCRLSKEQPQQQLWLLPPLQMQ